MTKILIVYESQTGNTEKMAEAIAAGVGEVKGVECEVKKVSKARLDDLVAADAIIMGSPTYYGEMSAALKSFIDSSAQIHGKLEGKVGAAFTSAGGTASGAETTLLSILQTMLVHGMIIQGRPDDKHYGVACVESPNEGATENCRKLGRRTAELTLKILGGTGRRLQSKGSKK
ncbi:MAG: NAD(P)H-dependent oxidoreductase [Promethearchaeati archaeon SRVP18_Atabeyarchaeia-1]